MFGGRAGDVAAGGPTAPPWIARSDNRGPLLEQRAFDVNLDVIAEMARAQRR